MKVATWNVNSIKARLPLVLAWLRTAGPDVVLLQETKVVDAEFPGLALGELGYNSAAVSRTGCSKSFGLAGVVLPVENKPKPRDLPPLAFSSGRGASARR